MNLKDDNIIGTISLENINNISKEIPVICFNASYNKSCTSDNIYRAYSWYDVYYNVIYKMMVN